VKRYPEKDSGKKKNGLKGPWKRKRGARKKKKTAKEGKRGEIKTKKGPKKNRKLGTGEGKKQSKVACLGQGEPRRGG